MEVDNILSIVAIGISVLSFVGTLLYNIIRDRKMKKADMKAKYEDLFIDTSLSLESSLLSLYAAYQKICAYKIKSEKRDNAFKDFNSAIHEINKYNARLNDLIKSKSDNIQTVSVKDVSKGVINVAKSFQVQISNGGITADITENEKQIKQDLDDIIMEMKKDRRKLMKERYS